MDDRPALPAARATARVVVLHPRHGQRVRRRAARVAIAARACAVGSAAGGLLARLAVGALMVAARIARVALGALLVLAEPLVRLVLVPLAFGSFLVAVVFGFALGAPHVPRWGLLAFSVAALVAYWLYLAMMVWVLEERGGGRHRH